MKGPIQSVEATYLVHATEDPAKVGGAVSRLLGAASADELYSVFASTGEAAARTPA